MIGSDTSSPYSIAWSNVAAASYSLTAIATDDDGATTTSAARAITVNVPANQPPSVALTAPAAGASFTAPANITVSANASDTDGSIARVDFYQGSTSIGSDTTSPYSITWSNVLAGAYSLTAVARDNAGAPTTSAARSVTVTGGLPSGWTGADVGSPAIAGSTAYNAGTFTIRGAGEDIWQASDQFHFAYRQITGDFDIVARVQSVEQASQYSKAGLMIRASLAGNAANAGVFAVASTGLQSFQRRLTTGAMMLRTSPTGAAPVWFKLERRGSVITARSSTNGATWSLIGSETVALSASVYAGLAVTSANASAAATAILDNVALTLANQPPSVALTEPATGAIFTAPVNITVSANASDTDGTIAKVDFYQGSTLIGSDTTIPYSITWSNVGASSYSLTAVATDDDGATTTSAARTITVNAPANQLPTVSLTAPANGATSLLQQPSR